MDWFWGALAGFGFGLSSAYLTLRVQRSWQKKDERAYARRVVRSLLDEVDEGLDRVRYLDELHLARKASFSRIYTSLWQSTSQSLAANLEDPVTLGLLHQIYYRFELINFNFEMDRPRPAGAFAHEYLEMLEGDVARLHALVELLT